MSKSFVALEKEAAAEFDRLIMDMIDTGILPNIARYDGRVFGHEVAKLVIYATKDHADAYMKAVDFLRRYGAMSSKRELYVASAVLEAAARMTRAKLAALMHMQVEVKHLKSELDARRRAEGVE